MPRLCRRRGFRQLGLRCGHRRGPGAGRKRRV